MTLSATLHVVTHVSQCNQVGCDTRCKSTELLYGFIKAYTFQSSKEPAITDLGATARYPPRRRDMKPLWRFSNQNTFGISRSTCLIVVHA
jgi:hypothetical protein